MINTKPSYLPTVEEIAATCRAIREGWNDAEHLARWLAAHSVGSIRDVQQPYEFPRYFGEVA